MPDPAPPPPRPAAECAAAVRQAGLCVALCAVWLLTYPPAWFLANPVLHGVQFAVIGGMLLVYAWGASVLAPDANPPDPGAAAREARRVAKALSLAPPGGITREWYDAQTATLRKVKATLVVVVAAAAVLIIAAGLADPTGPVSGTAWIWQQLQSIWHHQRATYTHKQLFVYGVCISHFVAYWGFCLIFAALDFAAPAFLRPYRIQDTRPPNAREYLRAALLVVVNQAIFVAIMHLLWEYEELLAPAAFSADLPSLGEIALTAGVALSFASVAFFFPHLLMHRWQWAFDHIHSVHHSFDAPFALCAEAAHPVEFITANAPQMLALYWTGAHVGIWIVGAGLGAIGTCFGHTGWQFPLLPGNQDHDFHHSHQWGPEGAQNIGSGTFDLVFRSNIFYHTKAWQSRVDKLYATQDYPVERILAQHGLLDDAGSADAEAGDGAH